MPAKSVKKCSLCKKSSRNCRSCANCEKLICEKCCSMVLLCSNCHPNWISMFCWHVVMIKLQKMQIALSYVEKPVFLVMYGTFWYTCLYSNCSPDSQRSFEYNNMVSGLSHNEKNAKNRSETLILGRFKDLIGYMQDPSFLNFFSTILFSIKFCIRIWVGYACPGEC